MAKKIVLLVAILVIIPLAISGCLFKKDSDSLSEDNQQQEEQQEDFAGSVQDLINRGKASKCTYDFEDDGVKVDGVVYTANKKARQDAKSEEDGKVMEVHIIVDDKVVYMWTSEDLENGVKMTIDMSDEEIKDFAGDVKEEVNQEDWQKKFSFKCKGWRVDESLFEPPSDVNFRDLSEAIENIKGTMDQAGQGLENMRDEIPAGAEIGDTTEMKKAMCAMCDNAPNPEECRQGLGCE